MIIVIAVKMPLHILFCLVIVRATYYIKITNTKNVENCNKKGSGLSKNAFNY